MNGPLELRVPGLRDMAYRQRLLAQPETMAYNRGGAADVPGYDPRTGCIAFPPQDWRYWRGIWLWQEPERCSALLWSAAEDGFVGEVCYFHDPEEDLHGAGVLIEHRFRRRGYGSAGLRLLAERAFRTREVRGLFVDLPEPRPDAVGACLRAGFSRIDRADGGVRMLLERKNHGTADTL